MRRRDIQEKNPIVRRIYELVMESDYHDNWKALSRAAKVGETTVRDILTPERTGNPGIQTLEKILHALGRDWGDIINPQSESAMVRLIERLYKKISVMEDQINKLSHETAHNRETHNKLESTKPNV